MDAETMKIAERTRRRREMLDEELRRSSSSIGAKRKSSDSSESTNSGINNENAPKRPSFKSADTSSPRRASLYPTATLDELKAQEERAQAAEAVAPVKVLSATNEQDAGDGTPSSTSSSRRQRFAALAAQVDEFDFDVRPPPCALPKSHFVRGSGSGGTTPRSSVCSSGGGGGGGSASSTPARALTSTSSTDERAAACVLKSLRFADPVAAVQMSFTEDSTVAASEDSLAGESRCAESEATDTVDTFDNESSSYGGGCGIETFYRPKRPVVLPSPPAEATAEADIDELVAAEATMAHGVDSAPTHSPTTLPQKAREVLDAVNKKKIGDKADFWERRIHEEGGAEASAKKLWENAALARRKRGIMSPTHGGTVTPQPSATASSAPRTVLQQSAPPIVVGRPAQRPPSRVSTATGQRPAVSQLRNRWELSSMTGTPLHPDADSDQLLQAAADLARKTTPRRHDMPQLSQPRFTVTDRPLAVAETTPSDEEDCSEPADAEEDNSLTEESDDKADEQKEEEPQKERQVDCSLDSSRANEIVDEVFAAIDDEPQSPPVKPVEAVDKSGAAAAAAATPLVHSVSFYRHIQRQQRDSSAASTPVVVRPTELSTPTRESPTARAAQARQACEGRFRALNEAVNVQQEQIAQASRALGFCRSTDEFRGSREEVEAQRSLLMATERRRVLLVEIDRVAAARRDGRVDADGPRGTLTISHVTVPLRRDFVNDNFNRDGGIIHYFICLLKHREAVHATQMITSDDGLRLGNLEFANYMQLTDLTPDFSVRLELYSLRTKREVLSHEEKYRIKGNTLRSKSRALYSPGVHSPGGPAAVLDPSFQQVGALTLTLASVNKSKFRFEPVHLNTPIEGSVYVKLRCYAEGTDKVEQRRFLTMYQEVGGIGSWTRYWCLLKEGALRFWRYPDDEQGKEALVTLDLSRCTTRQLGLVARDECPRPNTLVADILPDEQLADDDAKPVRILLSADNADECKMWMARINETLKNLHMWYPESHRPQTSAYL